ncbi:hypothetical protein [Streptomyces sp. NPDC058657]|uniref:hypothetical protein n=1 Tax=unclassified Streptomyces TaxID=2593676 RepID=UPI003650F489
MTHLPFKGRVTGMRRGHIRFPFGTVPAPFGCRWCGHGTARSHGRAYIPSKGIHGWEQPTPAQILARMRYRRRLRLQARALTNEGELT